MSRLFVVHVPLGFPCARHDFPGSAACRRLVALSIALLALASGSGPRILDADVPDVANVLVILADDLGYGDPGCYNPDSRIPTPAIDRLAREGLRFTDAHSPSAVCTPTRYGLLTGRYAWRTRLKSGVLDGRSRALIEPGRPTLASFLRGRGYDTMGVGKWHLGLGDQEPVDYSTPLAPGPVSVGFGHYFGIPASLDMEPYLWIVDDHVLAPPVETIAASTMRRNGGEGFWRAGAIAPGFRHIDVLPKLGDEAVAFIERHAKEEKNAPFFLYLALSAPHTPWLPTPEFEGKSGAGPYGDFAVEVDHTIGRVLQAIDRLELRESTLVFFTSDNGAHWLPKDIERWGHRANGDLRGQKADIWEGGHRVPFIVRWPGKVAPGTATDRLSCHTDIIPTVAEVIGAKLPEGAAEDGSSFAGALLGRDVAPRRGAVVHHSLSGAFAVREGPWKLILHRGSGGFSAPRAIDPAPGEPTGQLYHLEKDPREEHNLWAEKPDVVDRLRTLLEKIRTSGGTRAE